MKRIINAIIKRLFCYLCYFLPIKKGKIVVSSYFGKGYGDNPKYIVEEILKRNYKKVDIVWLVNSKADAKELPKKVKPCIKSSYKSIYHMATANVWIDNCRKYFKYKKKKQFYLQTWHGFALKRIEKDVCNNLNPGYVNVAQKDSSAIDIIVSCSKFMESIYKKSFWYNGKIENFGAPRNDIIINQSANIYTKVKEQFSICEGKKIVLYAPTFRKDKSLTAYNLDYQMLLNACNEKFGKDFIVLVRLHPIITDLASNLNYSEKIINASSYPDMQELLVVADVLITDYSSLMFDFALSNKPVFLFATDIDDYKNDRNFYFNLQDLPFSISTNNEELAQRIMSLDESSYIVGLNKFYAEVGMNRQGRACEMVVDLLEDIMKIKK